jgi:ferrochelatase
MLVRWPSAAGQRPLVDWTRFACLQSGGIDIGEVCTDLDDAELIEGGPAFSGRWDDERRDYDALLVLCFGGPEGPGDVIPFLENVTRGRGVPRERLLEVAEHYLHFGGVSPINQQNRDLIAALQVELRTAGIDLPIYFGNRNWSPFLSDSIRQMMADDVSRCLVFVTSAFSSYSGCRQYREDIERAIAEIGDCAITFDKIRVFYNHPGFVETMAEHLRGAIGAVPAERQPTARVLFTAHSIPVAMARRSAYEAQLREACRLVAATCGVERYRLVYQSRSGSPHVPWLEPDVVDTIEELAGKGTTDFLIVPIGFISDHMEVLFDLDIEAAERAAALGVQLHRVPTVGTHPRFVAMIRELIEERMGANPERPALGTRGPNHDICPPECCLIGTTARAPVAAG